MTGGGGEKARERERWTNSKNMKKRRYRELVSWCFKPSQPQRIVSGLRYREKKRTGVKW